MSDLIGAGGGGGGSRTPTRTADTLVSQDYFELVLGLSEGPIKGLVKGTHSALENFFVGTTQLANSANGEANFPDFNLVHYLGYENDPALKFNLGGQASNIQIGVRLSQQTPVTRTTPANLRGTINRLEIRIQFNQLVENNNDGTFEADAKFRIRYKPSLSPTWTEYQDPEISIRGKTTSGAVKDFVIDVPVLPADDWDIQVIKNSGDNFGDKGVIVEMTWESVQALSMAPRQFKDIALVHIYGRASNQFSSIPDFSGVYDGMLVRVPTNYNPETRIYDETVPWNGSFKLAFTNNPAWILYELCMNERWGLPRYYLTVTADRYEFYVAAKWCDEMVSIPGTVEAQPRFTFNEVFQDAKNGVEALNYIAGSFNSVILDDGTGTIILRTDQLRTPKQLFSPENVQNGEFNYSYTDIATRYNDVTCVFINPDLDWSEDRRSATIDNTADIAANGRIPTEFVAVGCTNVHEAVRRANYHYLTSNTEKATVNFVTSRFGMFTQPFETIYVADPLAGWSKPGRIKNIADGKIYFRDPVYFSELSFRTLTLQTFDGLYNFQVLPPQLGACYFVNIQAGNVPAMDRPDRAVFTIQDTNTLGLAKPFKVLSIDEIDGSPDAYKITALEINVNKYPDSDAGAVSESVKYSYQIPGEPILPPELKIDAGRAQLIIHEDGSITYRAEASWTRPFQAFTDYYELDYREIGEESWRTLSPIYGDSTMVTPLKDNTRYNFRLFAVTPLGKRSMKYLEVLNFLVSGKVGVLENVSGLSVVMTDSGWRTKWNVPSFPDYDVTELRLGLSVQTWESLSTYAKTKADRVDFGWLAVAEYRMYAKYMDTSKNSSDAANYVEWEVLSPMTPVLSGEAIFNAPLITWENAQTTQPIRLYRVRRGPQFNSATIIGTTVDLQFAVVEPEAGLYRYWVEAEDMAGNLSQPSSVEILVLPTITDAIEELQEGLLEAVADLLNINSGFSDRLLGEAIERGTAITVLQNLVTEGDEQLAQQIEILTAKAVGYIRGNLVFNSGFEFDMEGWEGDTDGWLTLDLPLGRAARDTSAIPAGSIFSRTFIAGASRYYTVAADSELAGPTGTSKLGIVFLDANEDVLTTVYGTPHTSHEFLNESARRIDWSFEAEAPLGTIEARFVYSWESLDPSGYVGLRMVKVEQGRMPATPYSSEATDIGSVAAVRQEATARASAIEAEAALRETLAVRVDGAESSIETESVVRASQTGALMARWGVRLSVGNKISGVIMNNNGAASDFVILTDKFAIAQESDVPGQYKFPFVVGSVGGVSSVGIQGNLFVDGSILGRSIAANTVEATSIRTKSLTANQIAAGAITADLVNVGTGRNMLAHSSWTDQVQQGNGQQIPQGWNVYSTIPNSRYLGQPASFGDWVPQGSFGMAMEDPNGPTGGVQLLFCDTPVDADQRYEFSVYSGAHRCNCYVYVDWYTGAGVNIAGLPYEVNVQNNQLQAGGRNRADFRRVGIITKAPAGAGYARMIIVKGSTVAGQGNSYGFFNSPMMAEATPNQMVFSPYSPGGIGTRISPAGIVTPSLSALSATIGLLRTSASGQRSELDDNGHRVYDFNNVLRTRAGIW